MTEKKNELAEKPDWGGWADFQPKEKLLELYNTAAKLNALFVENTDTQQQFWGDVGEDPDHFGKAFGEAMEYCAKASL